MIDLPSTPLIVLTKVIAPAASLLPQQLDTPKARVLWLAVAGQESDWASRVQEGGGPAHGLWQFEKGGGVHGVLTHPSSESMAKDVCRARAVAPNDSAVYAAIMQDDILAAAFARLLLYTDPRPLPEVGNVTASWDYYERNWQPGRPRPERWRNAYTKASQAVSHG